MSYYCERINCNCKYCDEEDGCIFYSQGSGNIIDMPCYEVDYTISTLYKIQELCKENNISIKISRDLLFIEWSDFESYSKPLMYSQAFSLYEIENVYETLDNVVDEFLTRRDKELGKIREGSDSE